jgi:cyclopropane-fatty-acyl-phospholipid synthase
MDGPAHKQVAGTEGVLADRESGQAEPPAAGRTLEQRLLQRFLASLGDPPILVELWDGARIGDPQTAGATVRIRDRAALYSLLYKPMLTFGELYTAGRIDVQGDLVRAMELVYPGSNRAYLKAHPLARLFSAALSRRARSNSLRGSRENIHAHYDLGNDFYSLWLDRDYTQYTCAYYPTATATLEAAQCAKLELVCRKLALEPGETVLEAGSGWGGLARYFARHYGVKVRSYNISAEQVAYARERARAEGFGDAIEYVEDDYRNARGDYDVFVSVGMLEHVGVANYTGLGEVIDRCLKDDGRGLIHSIGQDFSRPLNEWIERYIFPGAYPPTLREMMDIFEPYAFSIVDVDNLRPHYAQTLRHWLERFDAHEAEVRAMFDESFVRAWRLYLSGSVAAFTAGTLQLFQVLFRRPDCSVLPPTRSHLYREPFDREAVAE